MEESHGEGKDWDVLPGKEFKGKNRVPIGKSPTGAEGEETHDWAAVPRHGVSLRAAPERVEVRQWTKVVRRFVHSTDGV